MFQPLPSPPAVPLWLDLLKATIGPLIAAIIFIVGLIWRDRIERRNAAQAWFEQTYITDGIEVILAYIMALSASLRQLKGDLHMRFDIPPLPPNVYWRCNSIMPSDFIPAVTMLVAFVDSVARGDRTYTEQHLSLMIGLSHELLSITERVRVVLLDTRVKRKNDAYKIRWELRLTSLGEDSVEVLAREINKAISEIVVKTARHN